MMFELDRKVLEFHVLQIGCQATLTLVYGDNSNRNIRTRRKKRNGWGVVQGGSKAVAQRLSVGLSASPPPAAPSFPARRHHKIFMKTPASPLTVWLPALQSDGQRLQSAARWRRICCPSLEVKTGPTDGDSSNTLRSLVFTILDRPKGFRQDPPLVEDSSWGLQTPHRRLSGNCIICHFSDQWSHCRDHCRTCHLSKLKNNTPL